MMYLFEEKQSIEDTGILEHIRKVNKSIYKIYMNLSDYKKIEDIECQYVEFFLNKIEKNVDTLNRALSIK